MGAWSEGIPVNALAAGGSGVEAGTDIRYSLADELKSVWRREVKHMATAVERVVRSGCMGLALLVVLVQPVLADGTSIATNAEIAHLMQFIRTSNCQFYRNGSWYSSEDAHDHLLKKVKYLRERAAIPNAEYVVLETATRSSMSGELYQIRCQGTPIVECRRWLTDELKRFRASVSIRSKH